MKKYLVLILFYIFFISTYGQQLFQKYYLSTPTQVNAQIFETADSNLLIFRQSIINHQSYFQLINANANGDTLRTITGYDSLISHFYYAIRLPDRNYLITGLKVGSDSLLHGALLKIDSAGSIIWNRIYHDSVASCITYAKILSGNNLLLSGKLLDDQYTSDNTGILLKTDSTGNIIWTKKDKPVGSGIEANQDGGFIIHGRSEFDITRSLIEKCDSAGNRIWMRMEHKSVLGISPVTRTYDSCYISIGYSSYDPHGLSISKYDHNGNLIFDSIYTSYGITEINNIEFTSDKGYLISGKTNINFTGSEILILKIDSTFNYQWHKNINNYPLEKGTTCFQRLNGSYIIMGNVNSYNGNIKGFSLTGFDTLGTINSSTRINDAKVNCCVVYPNPFSKYTNIEISPEIPNNTIILTLYNLTNFIKKQYFHYTSNLRIDRENLKSGIYFYQLENQEGYINSGKLIIY